ncbi:MAG: YbaK/EbsC family protein [Myxococcales bacterium]|jgi:Ala-tRNA(Pro) deacylase|nr:YbaK/EbsC family protein [Myxococcales bacterium]
MTIAKTVQWYLEANGVSYETLQHPYSRSSAETADVAFIWEDQLVKTVLLEDERGYLLAIVPASYRVDLKKLERQLNRKLELASEAELADVFPDCEIGALPPLGHAYGIPTVYDDRLRRLSCVYFEGGDHCDLIYMGGREFIDLLRDSPHGDLCRAV